jgi:hypothetical protein
VFHRLASKSMRFGLTAYKAFSLDAARTANAMREWMPFDIESGDEKINALIGKYKSRVNEFHSETKGKSQGVTLNCLRLYHSP